MYRLAWSDRLNETPRLRWMPHRCFHDQLHLVLSASSMSRRRHENVTSTVTNGKHHHLVLTRNLPLPGHSTPCSYLHIMPLLSGRDNEFQRAGVVELSRGQISDEESYCSQLFSEAGYARSHRNIGQQCECYHSCLDAFKSTQSTEEGNILSLDKDR